LATLLASQTTFALPANLSGEVVVLVEWVVMVITGCVKAVAEMHVLWPGFCAVA